MHPSCRLLGFAPFFLNVPLMFAASAPEVPDWAQPGSATHQQVPPPKGYRRATTTTAAPIGVFEGQSDIGSAVVPGRASFDPAAGRYTIDSAGYNIWYTRDEFRFLWRKLSGDLSLAADIAFPKPEGYGDRKAVLIVRQDLDDDAQEAMVALHGAGLLHLAFRPAKGGDVEQTDRLQRPGGARVRLGIEKRGDAFTLLVGLDGGPMRPVGQPVTVHFDGPFYAGIGFTSHLPATSDTAVLSNVVLENAAGHVR